MKTEARDARKRRAAQSCVFVLATFVVAAVSAAQGQDGPPQSPARDRAPAQKPLNEQFTTAASEALKAGQYEQAITNAEDCIKRFRDPANQIQAKLEADHAEIPVGTVSPTEKQVIANNGMLNDVATCLFIKGEASEKLGRKEEAVLAYTAAKKYSYARAWDGSSESFWSPAEAAAKRLSGLR